MVTDPTGVGIVVVYQASGGATDVMRQANVSHTMTDLWPS